jgi:hypothetical protein
MSKMAILARRLVLAALLLAAMQVVKCPIDGSRSEFTGETMVDPANGKCLLSYKCLGAGHTFWVVANGLQSGICR